MCFCVFLCSFFWLYGIGCGCVCLYVVVCGCVIMYVVVFGCVLSCVVLCGCVWLYVFFVIVYGCGRFVVFVSVYL